MKTIKFTFKGKAKPLGLRWMEGFREGYELAFNGKSMTDGKFGDDWGGAPEQYGNGFAEGCLSGRSERNQEEIKGLCQN